MEHEVHLPQHPPCLLQVKRSDFAKRLVECIAAQQAAHIEIVGKDGILAAECVHVHVLEPESVQGGFVGV